jgi:DNA-binding beta-propeller fold protein YncE
MRPCRYLVLLVGWCTAALVRAQAPVPASIPIPGGENGVGFDDLRFSSSLGRVLVPGGRTGAIVLVEPKRWIITRIGGFSTTPEFSGGHDDGVTSVDEGRGYLFATDRTALRIAVVDPAAGRVVGSAKLASSPDYVRYVSPTDEVWVTQPDEDRIEVFRLEGNPPRPVHDAFVEVAGGPESLVVDPGRLRAFTHLWKGETVSIHLKNRSISAKWANGCDGSRGIALDESRGFLFVGCAEGKGVTLDAKTGKVLGSIRAGTGIDVIDYSPKLGHLYLPGAKSGTLSIVKVAADGGLQLLDTVPTAGGAHCAAADADGFVYVCDPKAGRVLVIPDRLAAAGP